jgi:DNA-binding response OmpR family regulator
MGKVLSNALKESGFVVERAGDGMEAVAKHKEFHPDLTVMDLYMPKMDGLEAIVEIRESEPDAKFIVLTSSSGKDDVMTAKTLNVVDYVLKTGEMEEIVGKVKNALA